MSYHQPERFREHQENLAALFISAAAQYSKNVGLQPFSEDSLRQMSHGLSDVAGEVLMFGSDAWPESAKPIETAEIPCEVCPSEVDPPAVRRPLLLTLGILAFCSLCAWLCLGVLPSETASVFFSLGIIGISTLFGTGQALLASGISFALHDLLVSPPVYRFSVPNKIDLVLYGFYLVLAVGMPWLLRIKDRALAASPRSLNR